MSVERFEELYERYCDGELAAAEREEFLALLSRPELRARFVRLAALEVALSEELQVAAAGRDRKGSSKRLVAVRLRRVPETRPVGPAIAAAAALAFLGLLAVAFVASRPSPERPTSARPREPRPAARVAVPEPAPPAPREVPAAPVPPSPKPDPGTPTPPEAPSHPRSAPAPSPVEGPAPTGKPPASAPEPIPPAVKAPPKPAPPRPQEQETLAFIAQVERLQGEALVLSAKEPVRAEAGKGLQSGQGLKVGKDAFAAVRFPDQTRLEFWPETHVSRLGDGPSQGKAVQLEHGILGVTATRQPPNRPLVVTTALAEATVLGTEFTLTARPAFTRIDVREGKVRFGRLHGGGAVTVPAGHFAIVGPGQDPAARPSPGLWKAPAQGLALWLRADLGVKANGQAVTDWIDGSPLGNGASQRVPASQPVLVPNAFAGRPAVRFDGVDDFLALPAGFKDFRAGLTAFLVARVSASPSGWVRLFELSNGGADDNISFVRKDGRVLTFWAYDGAGCTTKIDAPGAWAADQVLSLSVVMGPKGNVTFYRNGAPVGSGTTYEPAAVTRKRNAIGKSSYAASDPTFQGEIAELLLYARALAEPERQHVESYLQSKYLDATAPPASWPGEK
jgi:ferric-dicitrate binding protein FerR (iron transport regulator)